MKKTLLLVSCLLSLHSIAQSEISPIINNTPLPSSKAMWDIQLSIDATTAAGISGQAAVAFYDDEFWTSMWASDTIIRYTSGGILIQKLVIPGVSNTRSITSDGTNLYFANASNSISVVDPLTLSVTSTITSAASVTSRFLTYDASLDGGTGGFWTGDFNTDIEAIDMAGNELTVIPAATHTLTGMYGAAIDGTILWIFHQGGANSSEMTALSTVTGTPTLVTRDVFTDFSATYSLTSGLAGGAFITSDLVFGEKSLIGLLQGTPSNLIVAYELANIAALEENDLGGTNVYPVPASDLLNIQFATNLKSDASVSLIDINGRTILNEFAKQGSISINFDVSSIAGGVYQLVVQSNEDQFEKRIVIR